MALLDASQTTEIDESEALGLLRSSKPKKRGRKSKRPDEICEIIRDNRGIKAAEIAKRLKIQPPGVYVVVKKLIDSGRVRKSDIGGYEVVKLNDDTELKYPRPHILAVDLPNDDAETVRDAGFNVVTGSFGRPRVVNRTRDYHPMQTANGNLPSVTEMDVVVVDLQHIRPEGSPDLGLLPPGILFGNRA